MTLPDRHWLQQGASATRFDRGRTGKRQGELLALRRAPLDFAGQLIAVNQNMLRGVITTPKNHQRRRVDMSAQLAAALAAKSLR